MSTFLTVVIPVFNEETRLHNLNKILDFFSKQSYQTIIIVVNDGSTDKTKLLLNSFNKIFNLRVLSYKINRGKGYAVKTGVLKARSKYILFTDIDLSTPLEHLNKFIPLLETNHLVIGTRKASGATVTHRQPLLREYLGKGFTWLSNFTLGLNVSDFTCGFKCFQAETAKKIFSLSQINRWGFDTEILYLAKKYSLKVKEVPINWANDPDTKVKFPQDLITSLKDLIKIKSNDMNGKYD